MKHMGENLGMYRAKNVSRTKGAGQEGPSVIVLQSKGKELNGRREERGGVRKTCEILMSGVKVVQEISGSEIPCREGTGQMQVGDEKLQPVQARQTKQPSAKD